MVVSKSNPEDTFITLPFPLSLWVMGEGKYEVSLFEVED